jgi:CheY-like chemotaxis protein
MAHILVIDDEEMARFTVRDFLEGAGHQVTEAINGDDGVALQLVHAFDLVITDMIMPKKEGVETVIELKQANPDQKIIAISGGGRTRNMDFLQMAEQFGADRILAKPFTEDELLESVDTCLSGAA